MLLITQIPCVHDQIVSRPQNVVTRSLSPGFSDLPEELQRDILVAAGIWYYLVPTGARRVGGQGGHERAPHLAAWSISRNWKSLLIGCPAMTAAVSDHMIRNVPHYLLSNSTSRPLEALIRKAFSGPVAVLFDHCALVEDLLAKVVPQTPVSQNLSRIFSTGLPWAAGTGRLDLAELLISKQPKMLPNLTAQSAKGCMEAALIAAAGRGHDPMIRLLLGLPTYAPAANCCAGRALLHAAKGGHMSTVRLLLELPSNAPRASSTCTESDHSSTPLAEASRNGHIEVVRLLMEWPQHPALADSNNGAALVNAAEGGHAAVMLLLLQSPNHPALANCANGAALVKAAQKGHSQAMRLLLEQPLHPSLANCQNGAALIMAATGGHVSAVRLLLGCTANAPLCDGQDSAALAKAVEGGHEAVAKILLLHPVHPAKANSTMAPGWRGERDPVFLSAVRKGMSSLVRLMLLQPDHAVPANFQGGQALVEAASGDSDNHLAIARLLLEQRRCTARADCLDHKAFFAAAKSGNLPMVQLLLEQTEYAPSPDYKDSKALSLAVTRKHEEVARLLLSWRVNPAKGDCQDGVLIWRAACKGNSGMVQLLIGASRPLVSAKKAGKKKGRKVDLLKAAVIAKMLRRGLVLSRKPGNKSVRRSRWRRQEEGERTVVNSNLCFMFPKYSDAVQKADEEEEEEDEP